MHNLFVAKKVLSLMVELGLVVYVRVSNCHVVELCLMIHFSLGWKNNSEYGEYSVTEGINIFLFKQ